MRIGGTYVGLGEGDRSPEIPKIKALLKRKFTPARNTLDDSDLFTPALTAEVIRVQDVYRGQGKEGAPHYVHGVVNVEFKYDVGLLQRPPKRLPIIFTQEGHMSDMFIGPCATTASVLEQQGVCHWKPIGDWNTKKLPFDKSGVEAWFRQLSRTEIEGPVVDGRQIMWPFPRDAAWGGIGFSRGAKDFCDFMDKYVLPPGAPLHYRLAGFKRGLAFGNPRRGRNAIAPWAQSPPNEGTSGIMQDNLFEPSRYTFDDGRPFASVWQENANDDDMFAEVDDDEAGQNQTAIAKIITENKWTGGPLSIWSRVQKILGNPLGGLFSAGKAAFDAIMFLAKNPNPHYATFAVPGDIEWMRGVAAK